MRQHSPAQFAALACLFAAICCMAGLARAVAPNDLAPAIELPGHGGTIRLADYRGKVVYLDFWASWCGPCRQSFAWMDGMKKKYAAQGFEVMAVNLDVRRSDADRFLAAVPAGFPIAFDPEGGTPKRYAVKAMPTSILIGRDGKVLARHAGFSMADTAALERQLQEALRTKP